MPHIKSKQTKIKIKKEMKDKLNNKYLHKILFRKCEIFFWEWMLIDFNAFKVYCVI